MKRSTLGRRFAGVWQLALVVAVVAVALGLSELLKPQVDVGADPPSLTTTLPAVTLLQPERIAFQPSLLLTGTVESRTRIDIAAQVGGRVVRVSPRLAPGAQVNEGELLFQVDAVDYEIALEATTAEIAAAKSDLYRLETEAALAIREWKEVYPDREPPPLAARAPQIAAVNARLMTAEANRRKAELALGRTIVRAPATARILESQLDIGQVINPNQPVATAYALAAMEIVASLSTDELDRVQPAIGRRVAFGRPGAAARESGEIVRIDAALDPRTRLSRIFVRPDNASGLIVGEFVAIEIPRDVMDDVHKFPASALSGQDRVWVVDSGRLYSRRVTIIDNSGEHVMTAAFSVGDGIVRTPPANASEGQAVSVGSPAKQMIAGEANDVVR